MIPAFLSPVVCNAGPLIGLARIDMAWLPFSLYPEVIVPEEVAQELLVNDSPDRLQLAEVIRKARRVASRIYGLQAKGTGGLLVEAENRQLI